MSKVSNRKKYKHNVDLVKYSEDGLRKRCLGCVEEKEILELLKSGYCDSCWSFYHRERKKGRNIEEIFKNNENEWLILKKKYKDVKKCNTCLKIKFKYEFYPDKRSSSGLQNKCIECSHSYNKKYGYVKERDIKYQLNKYHNDIQYKIKRILRNRFYAAVINGFKIKSVIELLGCSVEEFKIYIEQQFKKEMTWSNHGTIWEIDHIKPCASFDLTKEEEQQKCFHFTNHQPLFKTTTIAESFGYKDYIGNREKGDN